MTSPAIVHIPHVSTFITALLYCSFLRLPAVLTAASAVASGYSSDGP